jgi:hypothetical protein
MPAGAREVLGKDHEGRVVISTDDGLIDQARPRELVVARW